MRLFERFRAKMRCCALMSSRRCISRQLWMLHSARLNRSFAVRFITTQWPLRDLPQCFRASQYASASTTTTLSGFYRAARLLAVYALPCRTRLRLAISTVGARDFSPVGCSQKFQAPTLLPFRPGFSSRTVTNLESRLAPFAGPYPVAPRFTPVELLELGRNG